MARSARIREAFRGAYPTASQGLIESLVELDEQLVKPYREGDWAAAVGIIDAWSRAAKMRSPESTRVIEAEALAHLSQAQEAMGRLDDAIRSVRTLLGMRARPSSGTRADLYSLLVEHLMAAGRNAEALTYATRGYRYSRVRDPLIATVLQQRIDQLRAL